MALSSACKEAILMRRPINEIGCADEQTPIILYGDNLSSQALAKNPVIRYHFVRQVVKEGQVLLKCKCTNEMTADILTKNDDDTFKLDLHFCKHARKGVENKMLLQNSGHAGMYFSIISLLRRWSIDNV